MFEVLFFISVLLPSLVTAKVKPYILKDMSERWKFAPFRTRLNTAKQWCQNELGTTVAAPHCANENNGLVGYMRENRQYAIWLGYQEATNTHPHQYRGYEDYKILDSGLKITKDHFTGWYPWEPNNWGGRENECMMYNNGKWNDIVEWWYGNFVCYKLPGSNDFELIQEEKTYNEAKAYCLQSQRNMYAPRNFLELKQMHAILGSFTNEFWIGFQLNHDGEFETASQRLQCYLETPTQFKTHANGNPACFYSKGGGVLKPEESMFPGSCSDKKLFFCLKETIYTDAPTSVTEGPTKLPTVTPTKHPTYVPTMTTNRPTSLSPTKRTKQPHHPTGPPVQARPERAEIIADLSLPGGITALIVLVVLLIIGMIIGTIFFYRCMDRKMQLMDEEARDKEQDAIKAKRKAKKKRRKERKKERAKQEALYEKEEADYYATQEEKEKPKAVAAAAAPAVSGGAEGGEGV